MLPVSKLKRTQTGMIQFFNTLPESKLEKIETKANKLGWRRSDLMKYVLSAFADGEIERLKVL